MDVSKIIGITKSIIRKNIWYFDRNNINSNIYLILVDHQCQIYREYRSYFFNISLIFLAYRIGGWFRTISFIDTMEKSSLTFGHFDIMIRFLAFIDVNLYFFISPLLGRREW